MIDRQSLFDADDYYANGHMPWSFLAWPSAMADADGLPHDDEALRFLALLQQRGIPLGVWTLPEEVGHPHTWAVVELDQSGHVADLIASLEREGVIPPNYVNDLTERLMNHDPAQ